MRGDLVLMGRGDPNLSNRKFPFEKAVDVHGVKEIEGDMVADDTYLAYERFPEGWAVDDILWTSGAPVSAIAVNDNTFTVMVHPGARESDPATFDAEPWAGFYTIENSILTGAHSSSRNCASYGSRARGTDRLSGTIPAEGARRAC